jgi:hypothetical protein
MLQTLANATRFDPSRFILEHYVDGDLVDETHPTHREKAAPGNLHVWGMKALDFRHVAVR